MNDNSPAERLRRAVGDRDRHGRGAPGRRWTARGPAWSADGATLVFADDDLTSQARRIEAIDVYGTNRRAHRPHRPTGSRPGGARACGWRGDARDRRRGLAAHLDGRHHAVWPAATCPDALAGAPLATAVDGPAPLTDGDRLYPAVKAELDPLAGVDAVTLMGVPPPCLTRSSRPAQRRDRHGGPGRWPGPVCDCRSRRDRLDPLRETAGAHADLRWAPTRIWT